VFASTGEYVTGLISASGNVTGGNILTSGLISAQANIIGGNVLTSGLLTVQGNIISGNVRTVGLITAQGNVTAGNVLTSGLISAQANIIGGNVLTSGLISAQGNITTSNNFVGNGAAIGNVVADRGSDSNDWNTLTQMGVYVVNRLSWAGTTGTPLDSQVFVGMLEVKNAQNTSIIQVFYPGTVSTGNAKVQWNRSYWGSSWTAWYMIVNDDQVVEGGVF
jgi:hypothetical protein